MRRERKGVGSWRPCSKDVERQVTRRQPVDTGGSVPGDADVNPSCTRLLLGSSGAHRALPHHEAEGHLVLARHLVLPSMRETSAVTASLPMSSLSGAIVVSEGVVKRASLISSKPTTAKSSGTRRPIS